MLTNEMVQAAVQERMAEVARLQRQAEALALQERSSQSRRWRGPSVRLPLRRLRLPSFVARGLGLASLS